MRILLIGGGGREHALAWKIAASPLCDALFVAPGNDGIARDAIPVDLAADDVEAIVAWAGARSIDLVLPGPEAPLVAGLADAAEARGIACPGPTAAAARLEGSKAFAKEIAEAAGVPTASWERFDDAARARARLARLGAPVVVKADGLAAGKGVTVAMTEAEAVTAVDDALERRVFGAAGDQVVIEEYLEGEEASMHVLCDGEHVLPLAGSQDHKRAGERDTGPNTGGMGACSPTPVLAGAVEEAVLDTIVRPTVARMAARGTPFKGVLYAGLMITSEGPRLLEYNVRFGDPECQVLMARLHSDLLPALLAVRDGELCHVDLRWRPRAALTVVMASRGYPGRYEADTPIDGLDAAAELPDILLFHAATRRDGERWRAAGGRVLGVTALGDTLADARRQAYRAVDRIDWPGGFCRRDIGRRALRA